MEKVVVAGLARVPSFSHAVVAGDYVHVAGSLGTMGDSTELVEGGTGPQTTQTLRNIEKILEAVNLGLEDVVKMNVYLADMSRFDEMNAAYMSVVGDAPPARITVGGVDLALGAAVEIDCIAYRGTWRRVGSPMFEYGLPVDG
jgi:2-iminobutanoate/2-iminopropanoate deaminase